MWFCQGCSYFKHRVVIVILYLFIAIPIFIFTLFYCALFSIFEAYFAGLNQAQFRPQFKLYKAAHHGPRCTKLVYGSAYPTCAPPRLSLSPTHAHIFSYFFSLPCTCPASPMQGSTSLCTMLLQLFHAHARTVGMASLHGPLSSSPTLHGSQ